MEELANNPTEHVYYRSIAQSTEETKAGGLKDENDYTCKYCAHSIFVLLKCCGPREISENAHRPYKYTKL